MSEHNSGEAADQERDDANEPAGDDGPPKFLKLLAIPIIVIIALVIIGLILLRMYGGPSPSTQPSQMSGGSASNRPAPPPASVTRGNLRVPGFEARTISGDVVRFPDDYRGKLVLLDFWATWCRPCVMEIPRLVEIYENFHSRGFEILGVTLDYAPAADVARFAQSRNVPWPHVQENAKVIAQQYQVIGIPATFLVDGDTGQLVVGGTGLPNETLRANIQKYLEQRKGKQDGG